MWRNQMQRRHGVKDNKKMMSIPVVFFKGNILHIMSQLQLLIRLLQLVYVSALPAGWFTAVYPL